MVISLGFQEALFILLVQAVAPFPSGHICVLPQPSIELEAMMGSLFPPYDSNSGALPLLACIRTSATIIYKAGADAGL